MRNEIIPSRYDPEIHIHRNSYNFAHEKDNTARSSAGDDCAQIAQRNGPYMRFRPTSLAQTRLRTLPHVRTAMRDRGQMPTMQGRGQRPRGPHRIYGWKGWGTRESKREERTYPWDNGMREGRMREMGSWARGLRMPGKYTTYLRGYGVSTRQKRSRKPTQTVFFTCPCLRGKGQAWRATSGARQ